MENSLEKKVAEERVVTVYATLGRNAQEFKTLATTWAEVQVDMRKHNISFSGMKVVIGETRLTLESERAVLPQTDFTLFLMPIKTKSGLNGIGRKELFETIKAFVGKDLTKKALFNVDGKNMTQLSTPVLAELVAKHIQGFSATAVAKKETPEPIKNKVANGVTEKVIAPLVTKNAADTKPFDVTKLIKDTANEIEEILIEEDVEDDVIRVVMEKVNSILRMASIIVVPAVETEEQKALKAEKIRMAEKTSKLNDMANDLMNDFRDVNR